VVINKKYVDDQSLKITKQPVENVAPWDSLR